MNFSRRIRKDIFVPAALALIGAAPVLAAEPAYREAAAPWTAEQAVKLPPAMSADFLIGVEKEFGASAAAGLAEKKEKVSGLVKRFGVCALNAEDLKTADKYLVPDLKREVRYFAERGCSAVREAASGLSHAAPQSASLSDLQGYFASGAGFTYEGSARFFDGAAGKWPASGPVTAGASFSSGNPAPVQAYAAKPLSSKVPAPCEGDPAAETAKAERPANIGDDGMVHQALEYWGKLRRENWIAYKKAESGPEKAKAFLKAAAGAGFGGLLKYSNLEAVETDSARLRWDSKNCSGSGAIAADSAKLVFNSCVFILALAPIPTLKIFKAALAGEGWATAILMAMGAGTLNHYIVQVAD